MDSSETSSQLTKITTNAPTRANQVQGPRPKPLKVNRDLIMLKNSPTIVYSDAKNFASVVKKLTGFESSTTALVTDHTTWQESASPASFIKFRRNIEFRPYEDMLKCIESLKSAEYSLLVSVECLDCVVCCSILPKDYLIDKDSLIQIWISEGLILEEPMEDIAAAYVEALSEPAGFISFLREDHCTGKKWYRVDEFTLPEQVLEMSRIRPVSAVSGDPASVLSIQKQPTHVTLQCLQETGPEALAKFPTIKMLWLLKGHKSNFERIPFDFFTSLKHLRTLNLSKTKVSELPSSIGSATCLHFLDLSETPIRRLPETIDCLDNLQTLKLQNCSRLVALPKATRKLTRLRHLDFGTHCSLKFIPPEIGALTCLHTLSEFVVDHKHSSCIGELKNMIDLGGKLCLSRLENIAGPKGATEANLSSKQRLKKLELRWTEKTGHRQSILDQSNIEFLRPHTNLQDLRILSYAGSAFPGWISHPSFTKLKSIILFKCENCQILPTLGQLSSLESLSLSELTGVRAIGYRFFRDKAHEDEYISFPSLLKLEIKSMVKLEEWRAMGRNSFPRLSKLVIKDCPKLTAFNMLSRLTALEYLEIHQCMNLPSSLKRDIPASVTTLVIEGCPVLITDCSEDASIQPKTPEFSNC